MASLKDRQQKTVTASGKPAFHPPGCSPPGRCAHGSVTRPCPCCRLLPCLTLQGKHSRECRFYQKCRASVGWRHARPACLRCLPDTVKKDFAPLLPGSRPKATGSNSAPQPERKSPYDGCRKGFFVLSSFPSCGKALCSATAFRLPPQALPQLQHEARPGIARCVLFIVKDGPDGQILLETETFL